MHESIPAETILQAWVSPALQQLLEYGLNVSSVLARVSDSMYQRCTFILNLAISWVVRLLIEMIGVTTLREEVFKDLYICFENTITFQKLTYRIDASEIDWFGDVEFLYLY